MSNGEKSNSTTSGKRLIMWNIVDFKNGWIGEERRLLEKRRNFDIREPLDLEGSQESGCCGVGPSGVSTWLDSHDNRFDLTEYIALSYRSSSTDKDEDVARGESTGTKRKRGCYNPPLFASTPTKLDQSDVSDSTLLAKIRNVLERAARTSRARFSAEQALAEINDISAMSYENPSDTRSRSRSKSPSMNFNSPTWIDYPRDTGAPRRTWCNTPSPIRNVRPPIERILDAPAVFRRQEPSSDSSDTEDTEVDVVGC